jgi:hypothetical protein
MDNLGRMFEQFKVHANDLGGKIAELIHEGNVRRIIIRDEHGHTFMEIPLTVATVGVVVAPVLAAVGAIAALVTHVTVVVERTAPKPGSAASASHAGPTDSSVGATDDKTDLRDTVPQRIDRHGTKVEDLAGTGQHDAPGG